MAILTILTFPDPRLKQQSSPVKQVDASVRRLVDDMLETMYAAPGIGLAAPQVGVKQRVIVMDLSEQRNQPLVLINPEIVTASGEAEREEGCLSVPGYFDIVTRPETITVSALDRDGKPFELETDGLLSVCIQHEIDHLDGKLFVDYLSSLKRQRVRRKLEKERRHHQPAAQTSAHHQAI